MSLVGFHARNHRQQVGKRGPNPNVDDRATTFEDFYPLHERFGFTIDVAAAAHNTKLERFYTAEEDGLAQDWSGERVWCNPPYSSIEPWVEKAHGGGAELVVMLLPANRTEQGWWQRQVEPYRRDGSLTVEFLSGRLRFLKPGQDEIKPNERPPFGCCLVIFESPQTTTGAAMTALDRRST
jgi:phage N-6-adenine-methyltransferase